MRRFFLSSGIVLALLAGVGALLCSRMDWEPAAPFDVIGVLWLFQNLPRLMGVAITFGVAVAAAYCFVQAYRSPASGRSDENTEARFRERFGTPPNDRTETR